MQFLPESSPQLVTFKTNDFQSAMVFWMNVQACAIAWASRILGEAVGIKNFLPQASVEPFHKSILVGFAFLNKLQLDISTLCLVCEFLRNEFRSIIHS